MKEVNVTPTQQPSFENVLDFASRVTFPINDVGQKALSAFEIRGYEKLGEYLGTDKTHGEIAQEEGISASRIQQITKKTFWEHLYPSAPRSLQRKFPPDSLKLEKPLSQRFREQLSMARGRNAGKIAALLRHGVSFEDAVANLTEKDAKNVAITLKEWGFSVPYKHYSNSSEFKRRIRRLEDPKATDEEIKSILDQVTVSVYARLARQKNPVLLSVAQNARTNGYQVKALAPFIRAYENAGISVGHDTRKAQGKSLPYYYFAAIHASRAQHVRETDPSLEPYRRKNRTRVLGKQTDEIPNTYVLQNSDEYIVLGKLFTDLQVPIQRLTQKGMTLGQIIPSDFLISVFHLEDKYYIRLADKETATQALAGVLKERGIL